MLTHKRHLILIAILAMFAITLMACGGAATPETITVVETVIVEKEGEVVTVIETVEVEKEVEKVVEVTKEVEVIKEVIVDPTECNLDAPSQATELNMIGWSFPITDFYADELEKCNRIDNLTVNTNLLASADAQEQVRLALQCRRRLSLRHRAWCKCPGWRMGWRRAG